MSMHDPISDMLTRIRNAQRANKADRVGIKLIENEGKVKRVRFFKSNGSIIGA